MPYESEAYSRGLYFTGTEDFAERYYGKTTIVSQALDLDADAGKL
jgi:hypothetical protein